jgi:hypothetical protein
MSPDPPTSRDRARRVRDDEYFKTPGPVAARTRRLSLAAGAAGAVVCLGAVLWPTGAARVASPGPLSRAHAAWANDCEACHVPWRPIGGGAPGAGLLARPVLAHPDDRCDTCHGGLAHFPGQSRESNGCAGCHQEHRGPDAALTRPPDAACTSCHARPTATHPPVTGFATDHPAFTSPTRFTRELKFSHAVHTAPGLVAAPGGRRPYKLEDVPDPAARAAYAAAQKAEDATDLVRLDCAACHQFQSGDRADGGPAPARSDGALFAPVRYEAHCRACHPLTGFDAQLPTLAVAHGGTADAARRFLRGAFADEFLAGRGGLLKAAAARFDRPPPPDPTAGDVLDRRVAAAERKLLGAACALCHRVEGEPPAVRPVRPQQVWLERAAFRHQPHRAVACSTCHAGAGEWRGELEPPMIGTVDDCRRCHAPAAVGGGERRGGAGFACTACHTYHDRPPHRGRAAPGREPARPLTLTDFLNGRPPR